MSLLFTFNGIQVISTPGSPAPSSLDFTMQEFISASTNPFTGQQQINDWQSSMWSVSVNVPPMKRQEAADWSAFFAQARGGVNAFLLGDPTGANPQGSNLTTGANALVNGANQAGYSINTKGWVASSTDVLKRGDWIQIGYRLHKVQDDVSSDASGDATISIWPNLRESPADGASLITTNCVGLFRLAATTNKFSISEGSIYGFQFGIREAI